MAIGGIISWVSVGCASSADIDWDMDPAHAEGEWRGMGGDTQFELSLHSDGTFAADAWPKAFCSRPVGELRALMDTEPVSFTGTYEIFEDFPYVGALYPTTGECEGVSLRFWKSSAGERWIQLDVMPADGSEPFEAVRLLRE